MVSWEICQGETPCLEACQKSVFAKHLSFLVAANLVLLEDKILLRRIFKAVDFEL